MEQNINNILGIIPCTKTKIWDVFPDIGAVMAKHAYINPFHHLARSFVHLWTDNWVILSAKYGLLMPFDIIPETYDVTFDRSSDPYISMEAIRAQIETKQLADFKQVMVVCNNRYVSRIETCFEGYHVKVEVPFKNIEDDAAGAKQLNDAIQAKIASTHKKAFCG